tara:strand:- start:1892 stop:2362 length:471 start_codon:yes stop_codon:yes gene_type:complete
LLACWKIDLISLKFLFKKISISSDHAGYKLKEYLKGYLLKKKIKVKDFGPKSQNSVDYPDFAKKVARDVSSKKSNIGILVCGSGTGMAMSANKFKKIRAAVCYNRVSTRLSRQHNNANIIALGARLTKKNIAVRLVNVFLSTKFEGGRHLRRVNKV